MHAALSTGTIEAFTAPTQDGAERTGATEQTVSDVLSGRVAVRPATETRARAAIAEPGYVPHFDARSLAACSSTTLGLIVPTVSTACHADVVEEAEDVLDAPSATTCWYAPHAGRMTRPAKSVWADQPLGRHPRPAPPSSAARPRPDGRARWSPGSPPRVLRTAPGVGSYDGHPQWELPMK
ncbi:LacI family DNA-binding transcriptional regulator [Streptomyces sp. NBC_00572]|nr:LacI family DNA-binding transcriptional regulator [Streptomyces sp. NBC_00572]